uniref:GIY-YIG endonuclease n=1 Tax=Absidia glauca TaxID=4829 RepID=A0A109PQQ9_ABSGL|nr:GIY-YIG endonuclease [Absidia glauca]AMA21279.1 GIY-YIG endonuclease [Absidia glauca]
MTKLFMSTYSKSNINPAKFYDNAEELKSQILLENKNKSGIYKWENKISGDFYIGSAVDLSKRMSEYYRKSYITHPSRGRSIICYALVKYDYNNFSLSILEYCDKDKVITREQYYLDLLNPSYNILKYAYSSDGYKHTLEAIQKISIAKKGRFTKENNSFYGKSHTEEIKTLMSQTALKRVKPNNAKPVFLKDSNNNIIGDFKSMSELSIYLKADKATLAKYRDSNKLFRNLYYIISKI